MSANLGPRVHWLGTGLSSGPGLAHLCETLSGPITVWARDPEKAKAQIRSHGERERVAGAYTPEAFASALAPADVVVSMLPADRHPEVAKICLENGAHLVTTSYLSPAMRLLDAEARRKNLSFVNEVGLDPGIDHLFAHSLVARMNAHPEAERFQSIDFYSLCGGFPAEITDDFRYRFSWSPLGVLRALGNSARWREEGEIRETRSPFESIRPWRFGEETLEMYPNRDSEAYLADYGFAERRERVRTFFRGTLRPEGWGRAWQPVFATIRRENPNELTDLAKTLSERYAYGANERDRVCLEVRLVARDESGSIRFDEARRIDESGEPGGATAMAKLVSFPAAFAVADLLAGRFRAGVQGAPRENAHVAHWLEKLRLAGIRLRE